MDEKNMQFANFNITFGEDDAPMLEHFSDIIFCSNFKFCPPQKIKEFWRHCMPM